MDAFLRVISGADKGRNISITGERFVIGRGEDADYRPPSGLVSREHCVIVLIEDKVFIEDLNSRNGTFVNGYALKGKLAANFGDELRIGQLLFEIVLGPTTKQSPDDLGAELEATETDPEPDLSRRTLDAESVLGQFFDRNG